MCKRKFEDTESDLIEILESSLISVKDLGGQRRTVTNERKCSKRVSMCEKIIKAHPTFIGF